MRPVGVCGGSSVHEKMSIEEQVLRSNPILESFGNAPCPDRAAAQHFDLSAFAVGFRPKLFAMTTPLVLGNSLTSSGLPDTQSNTSIRLESSAEHLAILLLWSSRGSTPLGSCKVRAYLTTSWRRAVSCLGLPTTKPRRLHATLFCFDASLTSGQ